MARTRSAEEIQLGIVRILVETPDHVSVREMGRRLRVPSSQVWYHLQRLVEMGVLVKRSWTEETGDIIREWSEYEPQPIFSDPGALGEVLRLGDRVRDATPLRIANCVAFLVKLSK